MTLVVVSIHSVNEILLDFQGFIETEPQSLNAVYCCFSSEATMPKSIGFGSNRMILIAKVIYVAWCHNHIEKYKRKGTYLVPVQCRGLVSSHPAVNGTPVEVCNSAIQAWRINAEMNNYGFTRKKGDFKCDFSGTRETLSWLDAEKKWEICISIALST